MRTTRAMARMVFAVFLSACVLATVTGGGILICERCSHPCESTTQLECMSGMCYVNTTGAETTRGCTENCEPSEYLTCCNDTNSCNGIPSSTAEASDTTTTSDSEGPTTTPTTTASSTTSTSSAASTPTTSMASTTTQASTTTTKAETSTASASTTTTTKEATTTTLSNETPTVKCHHCDGTGCGLSDMTSQEEVSCKGKCFIQEVETSSQGVKEVTVSRDCTTSCTDSDVTEELSGSTMRTVRSCCDGEKCNGKVTGAASTDFQCYKCSGNAESKCATDLTDIPTVGCKTKCYMKTIPGSDTTQYERGCALQCSAGKDDSGSNYTCCSTEKCNKELNLNPTILCHACGGGADSDCGLTDMTSTKTVSCKGRCYISQTESTSSRTNQTTMLTTRGCLSVCTDSEVSFNKSDTTTKVYRSCCDGEKCNGKVTGVAEKSFNCHMCSGDDTSSCGTDLNGVPTTSCKTQCYTQTKENQYKRGCQLQCKPGEDSQGNTFSCCNTEKCNTKQETPSGHTKCYKCTGLGSSEDCPEDSLVWEKISPEKKAGMQTSCKGKCFKSVTAGVKTVARGCTPLCVPINIGAAKMACCNGDLCNGASTYFFNMAALVFLLFLAFTIRM